MYREKFVTNGVQDVDAKQGILTSYVSMFKNQDGHGDIISKGAYSNTIKEDARRIRFLFNHNPNIIIGKPLEMKEDAKGLLVRSQVTKAYNGDYITLLEEGALCEFSVVIELQDYKANPKSEGYLIDRVKLWEYSAVTWGANPNTSVESMKGQFDAIDNLFKNGSLKDDTFEMLVDVRNKLDEAIKKANQPKNDFANDLSKLFPNFEV